MAQVGNSINSSRKPDRAGDLSFIAIKIPSVKRGSLCKALEFKYFSSSDGRLYGFQRIGKNSIGFGSQTGFLRMDSRGLRV
jgi:hypothetical protein